VAPANEKQDILPPGGVPPAGPAANTRASGRSGSEGAWAFDAAIFDMDGVITRTAEVHSRAWKRMFDDYLRLRAARDGTPFREFTHEADYLPYVDGRPRYQGVEAFLLSRGIILPHGTPADAPAAPRRRTRGPESGSSPGRAGP